MAVWYSLWSFVICFPIWHVLTKKNLATLVSTLLYQSFQALVFSASFRRILYIFIAIPEKVPEKVPAAEFVRMRPML
jgi:hypothetical protein